MKILNRYLLRETFLFFGICLFAFTGILLTLRMLHFASLIVNKGVEAQQILGVFISIIPTFLEIAIPMATLLGVMMALSRLSGDSEIIVIRASGISVFQLVLPIILFGLFTATVSFIVAVYLKPWGYHNLSKVLFEIARSKSTSGLTEGVFNPLGSMTLYTERIDYATGRLDKVLIDDKRDKESRKIIFATKGRILSDDESQTISLHLSDGAIHEVLNNRYVITKFIDNSLVMDAEELLQGDKKGKSRSPRELTVPELRQRLDELQEIINAPSPPVTVSLEEPPSPLLRVTANPKDEAKKKFRRTETELGSRFSMPFASFVLALIALPLGILPPRAQKTWGAGLSVSLGLLVFVFYYGLLSVGVTLGENGAINSLLGLWIPNIVTLGVGIFLVQRIASEQWTSVAERLGGAFSALRRRFHWSREAKA